MTAVDTTILVYAHRQDSSHDRAASASGNNSAVNTLVSEPVSKHCPPSNSGHSSCRAQPWTKIPQLSDHSDCLLFPTHPARDCLTQILRLNA
jgi:hypothetical protein